MTVADLMSTALLTVTATESLTDAHSDMELGVDVGGALIGVVTQTDYLDLARRALHGIHLER